MATQYLDKSGLTHLVTKLKTLLDGKVSVETGKGLSSNDLTDAMVTQINKIDGLVSAGGEPNVLESVSVNGTAQAITNKGVDITVPTKVSQIENDSNFVTQADIDFSAYYPKTSLYTKDETDTAIATAVGNITGISYSIVESLPATGEAGVIYLIANTGSGNNVYDEYIYVNNKFELIGTTEVDLTDYAKTADFGTISTTEIDEMFTGE